MLQHFFLYCKTEDVHLGISSVLVCFDVNYNLGYHFIAGHVIVSIKR